MTIFFLFQAEMEMLQVFIKTEKEEEIEDVEVQFPSEILPCTEPIKSER